MKNRFFGTLIIVICACAHTMPALAWGQEGHRIIAKIAYDNLSKKARKNIDRLMGQKAIIFWANWPDEIKSDTIYPQSIADGWHYQDFNPSLSDSLVADALIHYPAEGGNLFRALDSTIAQVSLYPFERGTGGVSNIQSQISNLKFIVHLSADRYCPMHMAHMDDKGGNAVRMGWFSKNPNTNLHSVWDTKLIESQGYSYTEYAEKLEIEYADRKKEIEAMTDAELLIRTYRLTDSIYAYQQTWDGNTYHYIYHWREPMEFQLYIAGIRLAQLLNQLYK